MIENQSDTANFKLDSRTIYNISRTYYHKVKWERPHDSADSEWIYYGAGDELDLRVIDRSIKEHFHSEKLLLDHGRHRSRAISQEAVLSEFRELISDHRFMLWDDHFFRVIEFAPLGVLRKGSTPAGMPR